MHVACIHKHSSPLLFCDASDSCSEPSDLRSGGKSVRSKILVSDAAKDSSRFFPAMTSDTGNDTLMYGVRYSDAWCMIQ